jgi:hypothetical protein
MVIDIYTMDNHHWTESFDVAIESYLGGNNTRENDSMENLCADNQQPTRLITKTIIAPPHSSQQQHQEEEMNNTSSSSTATYLEKQTSTTTNTTHPLSFSNLQETESYNYRQNNMSSPILDYPTFPTIELLSQDLNRSVTPPKIMNDNNGTQQQFDTDASLFETGVEVNPTDMDAEHITRYLFILMHASGCFERRCSVKECHKMRAFIGHVTTCSRTASGCRLCRRFFMLSRLHSKSCDKAIGHCPVMFCSHFKIERLS